MAATQTALRRKRRVEEVPEWLATHLRDCPSSEAMAATLREFLALELLPPGARLPSIRRLRDVSGLRHHEVCHALEALASEARIEQRPGSGTFVTNVGATGLPNENSTYRIGVVPPPFDPRLTHPGAACTQSGIVMAADLHLHVQIVPPRLSEEMPLQFIEQIQIGRAHV